MTDLIDFGAYVRRDNEPTPDLRVPPSWVDGFLILLSALLLGGLITFGIFFWVELVVRH